MSLLYTRPMSKLPSIMADPTSDDMRSYLTSLGWGDGEDTSFEREGAIYWFANDYHGGQFSNLYSALSTSLFAPGPTVIGPAEGLETDYYEALVEHYREDGL